MIKGFDGNTFVFEEKVFHLDDIEMGHVLSLVLTRNITVDVDGEILYKEIDNLRIELNGHKIEIPSELVYIFVAEIDSIDIRQNYTADGAVFDNLIQMHPEDFLGYKGKNI